MEREPVLLLQVVDAAGVPDNVLVTVAVLGTVCVTVVVTGEGVVSVTVVS